MAEVALTFHLQPAGDPTTGLWCDTCQLPSAASWPLVAIYRHGVLALAPLLLCNDCTSTADAVRIRVQLVADEIGGRIVDEPA